MLCKVTDEAGHALDAKCEIEDGSIILHSRGGTRGSRNARNTDYSKALRLLLERLSNSQLEPTAAWVDSSRVQDLPMSTRQILSAGEGSKSPRELFTLLSSRMARGGRQPKTSTGRGNTNKRIKIQIKGCPFADDIVGATGCIRIDNRLTQSGRIPAEELHKVTPEHIWRAVQKLLLNDKNHSFGPSTEHDVIVGNVRLPPKAIFGVALTDALGVDALPDHFSSGLGSIAFHAIRDAGFEIVPKGQSSGDLMPPQDPEDRTWTEGNARLVSHLRRERAAGLAHAKKAQFIRLNGKLSCERCKMEPDQIYGPDLGDACIEVHHRKLQLNEMKSDHQTKLEDLECLCANCHRVVHRELKRRVKRTVDD